MEESQEEKIQRLVKEGIAESEKARADADKKINLNLIVKVIAVIIVIGILSVLIWAFVFATEYQQVEKVSYNTGDVIKTTDNGTTFQIDTTRDSNGIYSNYVAHYVVRTVYLYNGEKYEEYITYIEVKDCNCEYFVNITEEELLNRFIKKNLDTNFNKIVITEQRDGYLDFELHWTGKDSKGTAYTKTQFSTYTAGNHKLLSSVPKSTPDTSSTSNGGSWGDSSGNVAYSLWQSALPYTYYEKNDYGEPGIEITGKLFMIIEYGRTSQEVIDYTLGLSETEQKIIDSDMVASPPIPDGYADSFIKGLLKHGEPVFIKGNLYAIEYWRGGDGRGHEVVNTGSNLFTSTRSYRNPYINTWETTTWVFTISGDSIKGLQNNDIKNPIYLTKSYECDDADCSRLLLS